MNRGAIEEIFYPTLFLTPFIVVKPKPKGIRTLALLFSFFLVAQRSYQLKYDPLSLKRISQINIPFTNLYPFKGMGIPLSEA